MLLKGTTRRTLCKSAVAAIGGTLFTGNKLRGAASGRIVLIAGTQSHHPGDHEYEAGCYLLQNFLTQNRVSDPIVVTGGWPQSDDVFKEARAAVLFMDGGEAHALLREDRLSTFGVLMRSGVGLACLHYAVEVPKDRAGSEFLAWLGGYFDRPYSVNPMNDLELERSSPDYPISRGWTGFRLKDEWYYRIRFQENDLRVSPILRAKIPAENDAPETLAWATQRDDGGRGFGFTGLHKHRNWSEPNFRRLVVNAVLWTAGLEVPEGGAACTLAPEDLDKHLFPAKPPKQAV